MLQLIQRINDKFLKQLIQLFAIAIENKMYEGKK
jgi:hypothetical protein